MRGRNEGQAIANIARCIEAAGEIDSKVYSKENATEDDIAAIRNSIAEVEPGIVFWYETKFQSKFSTGVQRKRLEEVVVGLEAFAFVVDLTRATKPSAEVRAELKAMFDSEKLVHVAIYTGTNVFLNIAAKFLLSSVFGRRSFEVVQHRNKAIELAREGLRRHQENRDTTTG